MSRVEIRDKGILGRFLRRPIKVAYAHPYRLERRYLGSEPQLKITKRSVYVSPGGSEVRVLGWTELHTDPHPEVPGTIVDKLDLVLSGEELREGYSLLDTNKVVVQR